MPLLPPPVYRPPLPMCSGHLQTIYPSLFRRLPVTHPSRERLITPDGDFLDIDWHRSSKGPSDRLAVVSHGLEGNSRKKYPLGMAQALTGRGWDVICLNFRGCSGEINRLPRLYHSGVTDDLHTVLSHGLSCGRYRRAALIGFSMGGNQTLKYLGEDPSRLPTQLDSAVVFSVPCCLADAVQVMCRRQNRIYMRYFMQGLRDKIRLKAALYPELIDTRGLDEMLSFIPFDDKYTGPLHGFKDGADYYERCSAKQFLPAISVATLMVQAQDDPFLAASCYPIEQAEKSPHLFLEMPRFGGHVGFMGPWCSPNYWSEERVATFLEQFC